MRAFALLPNLAAISPQGHDHPLEVRTGQRLQSESRALAKHPCLVVVHGNPGGLGDEVPELVAVKHGQALPGVENEWNARLGQLRCMSQHRVPSVRCHDGDADVVPPWNVGQVGLLHGARVEGGDLVVVGVGDDHRLRGVGVGHLQHLPGVDAQAVEPVEVSLAVVAHRGHHHRLAAERGQRVGDVAGAASELAAQRRHQERDIQDVDLIREYLLGESALEVRDGVERKRAANQDGHDSSSQG